MPTPDDPRTRLRIRQPHDAIAVVPYLLGHHPSEHSLVILGIRDHLVVTVARIDLPDPADTTATVGELLHLLATHTISDLIVVGYGPADAVTLVIDAVRDQAPGAGITVQEALRVTDGRYTSYLCDDPACHPASGTPVDPAGVIAVEAILAGYTALPDRNAVAARIEPVTGDERRNIQIAPVTAACQLAQETSDSPNPADALLAAGDQAVTNAYAAAAAGRRLETAEIARLGLLLEILPIRDRAWTAIDGTPAHIDLWVDVCRRVEPESLPAAASLLGFAAWQAGNGVLARIAVDAALAVDAHYTMAGLLRQALNLGMNPAEFRDLD